jgi:hypothetical protein
MKATSFISFLFYTLVFFLNGVTGLVSSAVAADYSITVNIVAASVAEGASTAVVKVILDKTVDNDLDKVLIDWHTANGSASAPNDFTYTSGTLEFQVGEIEKTISIAAVADGIVEGDETLDIVTNNIRYANSGNTGILSGGAATTTITITDSDTAALNTGNASASEGSGTISFTVTLDKAVSNGFTVAVLFAGGTAVGGSDYAAANQNITFVGTAGESHTVTVPITNDAIVEGDETFTVTLTPSHARVNGGTASGTIRDDDKAILSINDVSVYEQDGVAVFSITSDKVIASTATVTFDFSTNNATASGPDDYTAITSSGSISNGLGTTISIPIVADTTVEDDETFTVTLSLSAPSELVASFAKATGTGTILNDDHKITLSTSGTVGTVNTTSGGGVSAPPNAQLVVARNDTPVFTIAATDSCYFVSDVQVNGISQGAISTYTFSPVTVNDQSINADFSIYQYPISAIVLGEHGTLTSGQIVNCGTTGLAYVAMAEPGYHITWLKVNGMDVPAAAGADSYTYTFGTAITGSQTIEVAFSQHLEVVKASPYGTITPVGDDNNILDAEYASTQLFSIAAIDPCSGGLNHNGKKHHISDLIVNGAPVSAAEGQLTYSYTFSNITQNNTIEALFTSFVDVTVGVNGSVETTSGNVAAGLTDSIEVGANDSLEIKAVPAPGFHIGEIKVNGAVIGYPETYIFENLIDKDSTYEVSFVLDSFTLEPVSKFDTIFETSAEATKAITRNVNHGTDSSFYVNLNDSKYVVYGILVDNISYPIPSGGSSVTYTGFTLTNTDNDYLEVKFTSVEASHRLEVQDYDTSPISDAPLDAKLRPKPASLMFVLDDSGSMDWEITTSESNGLFKGDYYVYSYPGVNRARVYSDNSLEAHNDHDEWKSQWSAVNMMFYNPEVTYLPWPTFSGNPSSQLPAIATDGLAHANYYRPRLHPWYSQDCTDAINLANGIAGADVTNCNTTTHNNNTFPMDDVFLQFEDTSKAIVIDNPDTDFSTIGTWEAYQVGVEVGTDYLVTTKSSAVDYAIWKFYPTETSTHEVYTWWVSTNKRSKSVPYTISCATCGSGGKTVTVNQQNSGSQWVKLGEFNFSTGETVTITLKDANNKNYTSCADAIRIIPKSSNITIINAHYYTWDDQNGDGVANYNDANGNDQIDIGETVTEDIYLVNLTNPIEYYKVINNALAVSGDNLQRITAAALPTTVRTYVPATDADVWKKERQNWADWFSYYRKRTLAATGAVAQVIEQMEDVEIGIRTINYKTTYGISQGVLPVNVAGVADRTNDLLELLYSFQVGQYNTPLRKGLQVVGQYFDDTADHTDDIGISPYQAKDDGDECKQVFTILMTDGYWNGPSPEVGDVDGDNGEPYADTSPDTLADVAMYYFETDLSSMQDLVPDGINTHQHMVTYTVAFGVHGTLNPADYDFNKGNYPTWPSPNSDARKVDDLWHAAVNGHGEFMSASRPDELVASLLDIMNDIGTRIGSGASVSVNGDEMYESINGQVRMFQTTYNSGDWHGDLQAYQIDTTTGEVKTSSPVWSAEDKLASKLGTAGAGYTDRIIGTFNGTSGKPFRWATLSPLQQMQLTPYFASSASGLTGADVLTYLRGDKTKEVTETLGEFRERDGSHPLGDFIHSLARFQDDVLYVGGNDGMLHAFRATDTNGGDELFAYVPSIVFNNLRELADPSYSHHFYVDNTPDTQKMGTKTMLVGGLGKGGKGYYCLDITDAATAITSESVLASRVKWEYPALPALLLTGSTFTFSSGSGTGGNDVIADSAKQFTSAKGFVVGKSIAIIGANYNDGTNSGTNDGVYKIKQVAADGSFLEVASGSFISNYGNGKNLRITASISDQDMGYSFSKAFFIETNDPNISSGDTAGWAVIFGNGYGSENGTSSLYILNPADGTVLKKIETKVGPFNGLSTPNAVDVNNDLKVDYVYAGDLLGNMWKFDLTSTDHTKWQVAYCENGDSTNHCLDTFSSITPKPLFAGLADQPITGAPDIMRHDSNVGYMVVFGTGKYIGEPDLSSTATQSLYGIWDWAPDWLDVGYNGARIDVGSSVLKTATLSNWPETDKAGDATHTLLRQVSWAEGILTEDTDGDNVLDVEEDINNNGILDAGEDKDGDGKLDVAEDTDGDNYLDTYSYYRIPSNYPGDWSVVETSMLSGVHRFYNKDINGDGKVDSKDVVPVSNVGWVFDLPGKIDLTKDGQDNDKDGVIDETGERIPGERVVNDAIIRNGKAILTSFGVTGTRCNAGAYSFLNERNASTGGMLDAAALDLNGDGEVNAKDYVYIRVPYDVNGDGNIDSNDIIAGFPSDISFDGRLYNPAILREDESIDSNPEEKKYFSTSQGSIQVVDEKAETRGLYFWQQIE